MPEFHMNTVRRSPLRKIYSFLVCWPTDVTHEFYGLTSTGRAGLVHVI